LSRKITILFVFFISIALKGQEFIGGDTLNSYYAVSEVSSINDADVDTVICAGEDLSDLHAGDKVLLIQMTGAEFNAPSQTKNGIVDTDKGSGGKYELLSVLSVNNASKQIAFTVSLNNSYFASEKIQLVKIYETTEAIVNSELSAPDWDGSKGGVLAMVIMRKLTLNANIDLTGKGFRGALPQEYTETCRAESMNDTMYFDAGLTNRGGVKGEGIKSTSSNDTIGPGNNFNGGGGGIGKYGGGGGGSNSERGGLGGGQYNECSTDISQKAYGGYGLESGETNDNTGFAGFYTATSIKKITFGGGGGGSTYMTPLTSTKGGDGGGIVILLADIVVGNDFEIIVDGESVDGIATAGAGGGGAGGTLMLDAATYSGLLNLSLRGGNGGSTNGSTNCGGAGGSGAGGIILASSSLPSSISIDTSNGAYGDAPCDVSLDGSNGKDGALIKNYVPELNGFTFNSLVGIDTICTGQQPNEIIGTTPKGEDNPVYQWLKSTDNVNWIAITGANLKDYQPDALATTTYFTRKVTFPSDITDTAISVQILVYDNIIDNEIILRDTVCINTVPGKLGAKVVSGGSGVYEYSWESSTDQVTWISRGSLDSDTLNETNALTQDTYYQRYVWSGPDRVCSSLSTIDTLTVLSAITNNQFENPYTDTLICNALPAGVIKGSSPVGGDTDYSYSWIQSADGNTYTNIPSAISKDYNPGVLTGTKYYKRIVYSGADNVCSDTTSETRIITVLPTIVNNIITSDSTRYCWGDNPKDDLIQDSDYSLAGGNSNYGYQWQQYMGTSWSNLSGEESASLALGQLTDVSTYRRIVFSGDFNGLLFACVDTSSSLVIDVIPEIGNDLGSLDEHICQESQPSSFTVGPATNGAGSGTYTYLWLKNDDVDWEPADPTNTLENYTAPILYKNTAFRRLVTSDICVDTSNVITISVYDSIADNTILGSSPQYTCLAAEKELKGSTPTGGYGGYSYQWQQSSDGISWSDAAVTNENIDFLTDAITSGTYYRRIVESGDANQCKNTSRAVYVDVYQLPTGDIEFGIDTLCAGETISINYSNLDIDGPWKIVLGGNEVVYTEEGITSTSGSFDFVLNNSEDIRILSLQNANLCFADTSLNSGLVVAKVYEVPVANAGNVTEACGLSANLNAALSTSSGVGKWTSSSDGVMFNDASLPNAIVTIEDNSYGSYPLTWTENNWQCNHEANLDITFYEQPLEVDAGEDQVLDYIFETQLDGNLPDDPATGLWTFIEGQGEYTNSTQYNTDVKLSTIGNYVLRWTIVNGACEALSDEVNIIVNDLQLSNGFSPNSDGVNDNYILEFPSGNKVTFTVLDRNGNVVRVISTTMEINWDGTNESGQQVPEDTYYYIIEEDGWPARKGFIDIRR
jgi:gliding motility-associated-like protein